NQPIQGAIDTRGSVRTMRATRVPITASTVRGRETNDEGRANTQADPEEPSTGPVPFTATPGQGITIPQHIVIPPTDDNDGNPRKYHINSEITISYDPRQAGGSPRPETRASGTPNRNQPVSITSNV
uniref:Uncharacterized protein n=1 Tax=Panagrolaimus sp. JU765 TaxID=591449 RepID=A0AC34PXQ7_9BILA